MKLRSRKREASLACNGCSSCFTTRKDLDFHLTLCRDSRRFCCCFCPREFSEKNILLEHQLNHHLKFKFFLRDKRFRSSARAFFDKVELFNRNLGVRLGEELEGVGEIWSEKAAFAENTSQVQLPSRSFGAYQTPAAGKFLFDLEYIDISQLPEITEKMSRPKMSEPSLTSRTHIC